MNELYESFLNGMNEKLSNCVVNEDFKSRFELCKAACLDSGLVLEFGVYCGGTLHYIAEVFDTQVFGFDSWQGLPKDADDIVPGRGGSYREGKFKSNKIEPTNPHIVLVDGWFKDTLPGFVKEHTEPCRFIHIDSDNYNSAKDVFNNLKDQIVEGTVIMFDEFMAHDGWDLREYRAFREFIFETKFNYEVICKSGNNERVAIKLVR